MSLATASPDVSGLHGYAFDWALVDVETSGPVARRDRVLSVAVVTLGPDGERTGEFSTLLNPGCDPGPVHVHGLTAGRLRGAPAFEQVAGRIGAMLEGRVLVAHNAQFDYDFPAHGFARADVAAGLPATVHPGAEPAGGPADRRPEAWHAGRPLRRPATPRP
jgi:DNA polymerase-3 subunit epsilon